MATKSTTLRDLKRQREDEVGSSVGTYFAVAVMITLLAVVFMYLAIHSSNTLLQSPLMDESIVIPKAERY